MVTTEHGSNGASGAKKERCPYQGSQPSPTEWVVGAFKVGAFAVVAAIVIWLMTQFNSKASAADVQKLQIEQATVKTQLDALQKGVDEIKSDIKTLIDKKSGGNP